MSDQIALFIDFENVALWAEQEFLDLELTPLMEYLQSRGPVVIKKVYGDWSRFVRYREDLMNNTVDLIQVYSIRAGKNRADIRMALDAFETAINRPEVKTFVIVSGDSDFGPLVNKLREYGRYILGIGPRDVTHPLLVKACDEFVYLESILDDSNGVHAQTAMDNATARSLLEKALRVHEHRGDLPVLAAKLKQTMLMLDSAFNETNYGYTQFKNWLENNDDAVNLFVRGMQLYVAPKDFDIALSFGAELQPWTPVDRGRHETAPASLPAADMSTADQDADIASVRGANPPLRLQYKQILNRLKMTAVDFTTRRDVLRDIYRALTEKPGARTTDELLEHLCRAYEEQGLIRSKTTLRQIWQIGFRQHAFDYREKVASVHVPVWVNPEIESEAEFVRRAESGFVYAVLNAGLDVDAGELAAILLNDSEQVDYIQELLDDLETRGLIVRENGRYRLPGQAVIPFQDDPVFAPVLLDIQGLQLPDNLPHTPEKARSLAKTAMLQRSQDFAASARSYLCACKLQLEGVEEAQPGANLEELRWYVASYASVKAGELSQIHRDYAGSRPYYLAFFKLVQEDDPLWSRMRGLINPMLSYYWINAWRELGLNMGHTGGGAASPAEIAVRAVTSDNQELCALWFDMTRQLAEVNPGLLRRVINQIRLNRTDSPANIQVAETLEQLMMA